MVRLISSPLPTAQNRSGPGKPGLAEVEGSPESEASSITEVALDLAIRVLPLCSGAHPAVDGSSKLTTFPERETYVYVERQGGAVSLTAGDRIEDYQAVIGRADEHILSAEDSARLIVEVRESMTDE